MTLRILTLDIETFPGKGYFWGLWKQNIYLDQLIEPSRVACVAAKWLDSKEMMFRSEFADGRDGMLKDVHAWLDEADAVVGYNSRKFDIKHLNRELFLAGFDPPSPFTNIDLMETSKKKFEFMSNKLQHLLQETEIGSKIKHEGFTLWTACMDGDVAAWKRFQRYCENDTAQTEKLYLEMLPWIDNHPSYGAHTGEDVCPNCGSDKLQRRGFAVTATGRFPRLQCQACGKWTKSNRRDASTTIVGIS